VKQRRLAAAAAIFIIACLGAAPALAERGDQLRLGSEPSSPAEIRILADFSHCVAHRQSGQARALLAMDFHDRLYGRTLNRLVQSQRSCAPPGQLKFAGLPFAGGLAEALLHDRLGAGPLAPLVAYDPARPAIQARSESETMSLCTVRAEPDRVAALLATGAGTPAEASALNGLTPAVGQCLAAGSSMRLNRLGLRAMLALAAWRLAAGDGTASH
jgi:hypothetical protein